jgi:hypothetical protein
MQEGGGSFKMVQEKSSEWPKQARASTQELPLQWKWLVKMCQDGSLIRLRISARIGWRLTILVNPFLMVLRNTWESVSTQSEMIESCLARHIPLRIR